MKYWVCSIGFLAVTVVATAFVRRDRETVNFKVVDTERVFVDSWMPKFKQNSPGRLTTFKYNNCGDPTKEIANITTLVIGPDPLTFPGTLTVTFAGTSKIVVNSPITVVLLLEIKVGSNWVKIPCISEVGSCTYEDICFLLSQITQCPQPLVAAGIPCQCPFPQGAYNLPQASFEVDVPIFPPGDYHAVANITNNANIVSCVELFVTFA